MAPKKRKYAESQAAEWLEIAALDLESAEVLAEARSRGRAETTLYMVQQSIEKSIKAVLIFAGIPVPLTHQLGGLILLVPESIPCDELDFDLDELTSFATAKRYESAGYEITDEDIADALKRGHEVLAWARLHAR